MEKELTNLELLLLITFIFYLSLNCTSILVFFVDKDKIVSNLKTNGVNIKQLLIYSLILPATLIISSIYLFKNYVRKYLNKNHLKFKYYLEKVVINKDKFKILDD